MIMGGELLPYLGVEASPLVERLSGVSVFEEREERHDG